VNGKFDNLEKFIVSYNAKNKNLKSDTEFETSSERIAKCEGEAGQPEQFRFVGKDYPGKIKFSYDADKRSVTVSLDGISFNTAGGKINGSSTCEATAYFAKTKVKSTGGYTGSNAFGARTKVSKVASNTYALVPVRPNFKDHIGYDWLVFKFDMDPQTAKDLRDNLAVVINGKTMCNKCSAKLVDFNLIMFSPTLSQPVDGIGFVHGLYFKIETASLYNIKTGEVLFTRKHDPSWQL